MRYMLDVLGLAVAAGMSATADTLDAQAIPGTQLTIDVRVVNVTTTNGITRVSYELANRASSREQVLMFIVDAPAGIPDVETPTPVDDWTTNTQLGSRTVALWGVLGAELRPGTKGPTLSLSGEGIPGFVRYWVQGDSPVPAVLNTDVGDVPPTSPLAAGQSVQGSTVGVVAAPADQSPGALTSRLREQLQTACGTNGLITNQGICSALQEKLDTAAAAIGLGNAVLAREAFGSLLNQLAAQRGKQIPEVAYQLIRASVEAILAGVL
ncbi:MAG: hypothetical protein ACJ8DC_08305 [Gemmatimonadales bacterium]